MSGDQSSNSASSSSNNSSSNHPGTSGSSGSFDGDARRSSSQAWRQGSSARSAVGLAHRLRASRDHDEEQNVFRLHDPREERPAGIGIFPFPDQHENSDNSEGGLGSQQPAASWSPFYSSFGVGYSHSDRVGGNFDLTV